MKQFEYQPLEKENASFTTKIKELSEHNTTDNIEGLFDEHYDQKFGDVWDDI